MSGRNPSLCYHQIQPEHRDEQTDAGRDRRTRLARPNSQARTGQGNINFSCSADREQDWQPYPVDLLYVMTIHTYTYINRHAEIPNRTRTTITTQFVTRCYCYNKMLLLRVLLYRPVPHMWEREAHINWSTVTCQSSTRLELP